MGQSASEYAILVGVLVAAALIGISTYVRRGLQAKYMAGVDAATFGLGAPNQYEPYYTRSTGVERADLSGTYGYQAGVSSRTWNDAKVVVEASNAESVLDLTTDDNWP